MPKKAIQLSDHFTYSRLLRFVLPCIGTMLFTSIYGIVDGLCVSNFVGKTAFAAVNLIMPLPQLLGTVGFMLGTGGSAIVGITLGEGDQKKADRYFSMLMLAALVSVSVLAVLGILLLRPVAMLLGAKGELLDYAVRYGRILMLALPPFALQNMFQSFFVTAEKPLLGFWFTVGAGCTNMVLDVVMVGALGRGGRCRCNPHQPIGGRRAAGVLFYRPPQYQPSAPVQNAVLRPRAVGCLHQRLFRADDQPFHVAGQYPV